ncbi:hypothetical protein FOZ63_022329 [Perkinsus olseni]|uniref:Putative nuclease HARBI1 n=1 Tax=Perkinsus olseni TaxID=32597 RepID=A0A7J6PAY6_PEROL|nr:hypothetical protein FOZ60_013554 [Perkinsus olseni]KAF4692916.1 hypothetical protein FOZ62_027122 [Perkinsus olseni]KAF4743658.1 hypothetical protein FOZ63_022329 [Perkinsus olseni]
MCLAGPATNGLMPSKPSEIGDAHGVATSSVAGVVERFILCVVEVLCPEYITLPTGNELRDSIDGFPAASGMMNVWAAVDGTHIKVHPPHEVEESYVNRRHEHSINCMIVCTSTMRICALSARWGGKVHDSRVFRNSSLSARLEDGWRPDGLDVVLLGDSGYRATSYLQTTVSSAGGRVLTADEIQFNERHRRGRVVTERCIGVLKTQFRCLKDLRVRGSRHTADDTMQLTAKVIRACAALRNFLIVHAVEQEDVVDDDLVESSSESSFQADSE